MLNNAFSNRAAASTGSARSIAAITPDDAADLPGGVTRGLFVGAAGNLVVSDAEGTTATIMSTASQYHPICVARVLATGTTAGAIIALY